jgi:hypothetical protein
MAKPIMLGENELLDVERVLHAYVKSGLRNGYDIHVMLEGGGECWFAMGTLENAEAGIRHLFNAMNGDPYQNVTYVAPAAPEPDRRTVQTEFDNRVRKACLLMVGAFLIGGAIRLI